MVAIHLRSWAVVDEPGCLCTGCHLRTVGSPVTTIAPCDGRWRCGCGRRDCAALRWNRFGCQSLTMLICSEALVAPRSYHGNACDQSQRAHKWSLRLRALGGCISDRAIGANGKPYHSYGLGSSVTTAPKLVVQLLADCGARTIPRELADVNEDLGASMRWSNESKASILVPTAESSREWHCET